MLPYTKNTRVDKSRTAQPTTYNHDDVHFRRRYSPKPAPHYIGVTAPHQYRCIRPKCPAMPPFVRAAGRCLASVKNPWTRNIDIAGAAIGSWPHTRTSPSSSRNNPRPRSFSCPSTAIIHQTTARFEPRRGAAIAAAFAAITTSLNFQNNSANFDNSAQCMPRINKEKGKKHHKKNGGNVKTIRASVAERRGA